MGFAAACFRAERWLRILRLLILASWPFGIAMLLLARHLGMNPVVDEQDMECNDQKPQIWGIVVLCCCASAAFFYAVGTQKTLSGLTPWTVRKRMLIRGLIYVLNFVITFCPRAISNLLVDSENELPM